MYLKSLHLIHDDIFMHYGVPTPTNRRRKGTDYEHRVTKWRHKLSSRNVPTLKLRAHTDAELGQAQLQGLAAHMTEKRREVTERVEHLEQQMVVKDDCSHADAADAASAQEYRLRARAMVEQHRQVIMEIDAAFRRLEIGSYGISETTGEPIDYKRLILVPWARVGTDDKES